MIRFRFDGILVDTALNWRDLQSILKYDDTLRAILLIEESNLNFSGSAYDYLNTVSENGFCESIDVSIEQMCGQSWLEIISGRIFISDVSFNERLCTATVKLQDRSFYAVINNNRTIQVSPDSNLTKNQLSLTPCSVYNLDVYNLSNALYESDVVSYRVHEVLRHIIAYISDNTVGYASTLFGVGGSFDGLCITTGYNLRTGLSGEFTQITFEEVIKELTARIPIVFSIENPYTNPVIRIETSSYFNGNGTSLTLDNVYEVIRKYDRDRLYTNLRIGSTNTDSTVTYSFPETIKFLGFADETFHLLGECNIDGTLDLTGNWIVSCNVIEKVTAYSDNTYDSNIFLFNSTLVDATNGRTTNANFLNLSPAVYFWNEELTNNNIADRYESSIPKSIASNYGTSGNGIFKAYRASAQAYIAGAFINTSFDTTNVATNVGSYFDGTDKFTAAFAGVYSIGVNVEINIATLTGTTGSDWFIQLYQYDSTGANIAIREFINSPIRYFTTGVKTFTGSLNIVMNAGDYITFALVKQDLSGTNTTGTITVNTYWECTANTVGGGVFKDYTPDDFPINLYDFNYPLSYSDWQALIANATDKIAFRMEGQQWREGRVKEVKYNIVGGFATFTLKRDSNGN